MPICYIISLNIKYNSNSLLNKLDESLNKKFN